MKGEKSLKRAFKTLAKERGLKKSNLDTAVGEKGRRGKTPLLEVE